MELVKSAQVNVAPPYERCQDTQREHADEHQQPSDKQPVYILVLFHRDVENPVDLRRGLCYGDSSV
jgi:hypothetical protein